MNMQELLCYVQSHNLFWDVGMLGSIESYFSLYDYKHREKFAVSVN